MSNPTRLGTPGIHTWPYWVETPSEQFIVYATSMMAVLPIFEKHRPGHEPYLVRQMSDNE